MSITYYVVLYGLIAVPSDDCTLEIDEIHHRSTRAPILIHVLIDNHSYSVLIYTMDMTFQMCVRYVVYVLLSYMRQRAPV